MMGPMYAPKPKCRDTDYIDFLIATPQGVLLHGGRRGAAASRPTPRPTTPSPGSCTGSSPTPRRSGTRPGPWSTARAASWSSTTRPWTSPTPRRSSLVAPPLVGQAQARSSGAST